MLTFPFYYHVIVTGPRPVFMPVFDEFVDAILRRLYSTGFSCGLHASCHIDCISENLKTGFFTSKNSGSHAATMHSNSNRQLRGIFSSKLVHQLAMDQVTHCVYTILCELGHVDGMMCVRLGQSSHSDVAVTNGFDLENTAPFGQGIKATST